MTVPSPLIINFRKTTQGVGLRSDQGAKIKFKIKTKGFATSEIKV